MKNQQATMSNTAENKLLLLSSYILGKTLNYSLITALSSTFFTITCKTAGLLSWDIKPETSILLVSSFLLCHPISPKLFHREHMSNLLKFFQAMRFVILFQNNPNLLYPKYGLLKKIHNFAPYSSTVNVRIPFTFTWPSRHFFALI